MSLLYLATEHTCLEQALGWRGKPVGSAGLTAGQTHVAILVVAQACPVSVEMKLKMFPSSS